jgi:hypothetical protein
MSSVDQISAWTLLAAQVALLVADWALGPAQEASSPGERLPLPERLQLLALAGLRHQSTPQGAELHRTVEVGQPVLMASDCT